VRNVIQSLAEVYEVLLIRMMNACTLVPVPYSVWGMCYRLDGLGFESG